jgi:membrane dipeptidase
MLRLFFYAFAAIGGILLVIAVAAWLYGAEQFDRRMNRVGADPEAPIPSPADLELHRSLFVADLHADTLKWQRDLLARSSWGHVDLPRLIEGNVGLQVFTIVTKSPLSQPSVAFPNERCVPAGGLNMAAILAALQGRPVYSLKQRAFLQIRRLKNAAERSRQRPGPELRLIETAQDLRQLLADRQAGQQVVGAILGIEGGHWVGDEDDPGAVEREMQTLFDLGVRQFAPTHRFDNKLSGASEGCQRDGLTERGAKALRKAEELGMAVDLAHISPQGLNDALEILREPFLISHTGIQDGCESPCNAARNLSDEEIALIVKNGGLIGVGYWPQAIGTSLWRIPQVMQHIMDIERRLGLEPGSHVALGSDYDGSVTPFFDASELAVLTAAMRQRSEPFDTETVRRIAGLNACRFFARTLPGGSEQAAREICGALVD